MDLIDRNNAITSICQWLTTLERKNEYIITVAEMKQKIADILCEEQKVDVVPMSVIDEIKVEIEQQAIPYEIDGRGNGKSIRFGLGMALEIIDRKVKEHET